MPPDQFKKVLRDELAKAGARWRLGILAKERAEILRMFPELAHEDLQEPEPERRRINGTRLLFEASPEKQTRGPYKKRKADKPRTKKSRSRQDSESRNQEVIEYAQERGEVRTADVAQVLGISMKDANNRLYFLTRKKILKRGEGVVVDGMRIGVWTPTGKTLAGKTPKTKTKTKAKTKPKTRSKPAAEPTANGTLSEALETTLRYIKSRGSATIEDMTSGLAIEKSAAYMRITGLKKRGLINTTRAKKDGQTFALYEPVS